LPRAPGATMLRAKMEHGTDGAVLMFAKRATRG
jgi:hypothetical protein